MKLRQHRSDQELSSKKKVALEKLTLTGRDGKVQVLRCDALLVSENFRAMVLRAHDNEFRTELSQPALEYFRSFIHGMEVDTSKIDGASFSELVDFAEMYLIEDLRQTLATVMIPAIEKLPVEKFVSYQKGLARLPPEESSRILEAWRNYKKY